MCGIAGIMTADGSPPAQLAIERMRAALGHRGPDGSGSYRAGDTAMAQTRLAIIDLVSGDQPIHEPQGAALIANAEIYNYIELRAAMPAERFATNSDCEPPLHLYRREGVGFASRLRGMYAIAIHDPGSRRLVLARDPFGIKPLYYAAGAFGLAFASEPQALIAGGFAGRGLRTESCIELLQLQFTTGRHTVFRDIERVLPGETLTVSGGRIVERHRRAALPEGGAEIADEAEILERLDRVIADSVAVHQRSDVAYGMFLSGGVDSSALLAEMARQNTRPVRAYTVAFAGEDAADERAQAGAVARRLGAEHVEVMFGEEDFWRVLPEVCAAIDDPTADYAVLPTYKLAGIAARDVKVVLTGEGGDELFGGYGRYRSILRPWWKGGRTMRVRGILDGLGILREPALGWRDGIAASEIVETSAARTRLQIAQAVDCADWLPNDLLTKLDRCLMAHGLEGRTPFLDPAVAALAFSLPDALKLRQGLGKWLLRKWLAARVPEANAFARKRGFTVPAGEWIARSGARIGALVANAPGVRELCHPDAVMAVFAASSKRARFAAWVLLYYALWHNHHVLGRPRSEDAAATLAAA